jgi:tetratricopeptide (TPR) repeat protein
MTGDRAARPQTPGRAGRPWRVVHAAGAALALAARARAHDMDMGVVGQVHLASSCAPAAQRQIDRGVGFLYSFMYDEARRSFQAAAAAQPACALAHWGAAMSDWQQVEGLPTGDLRAAAQREIAAAQGASRQTARESAYVAALSLVYQASSLRDEERLKAYAAAMGALAERYPGDRQAPVLYALALLSLSDHDPDLIYRRRALRILNRALTLEPHNPGIIHFIIHASDNPGMARYGLTAARRYARVAPASAHARHMPGHIFARLGLWRDDIRSNLASKAAAEAPAVAHAEAQNRLHAIEFLQYAYLQVGDVDRARAVTAEAALIAPTEVSPGFDGYYGWVQASLPARFDLETGDWCGALALSAPADGNLFAKRSIYWAHAVAAGHLRDAPAAAQALADYRATLGPEEGETVRAAQLEEVKAWALFAEGRTDAAVAGLSPVADTQDRVGKGEVELPAREMLGDMLRLAGRPAEALTAYRASLRADPGRFETLLHAAETAAAAGDDRVAARLRRRLLDNAPRPTGAARDALAAAPGPRAAGRAVPPPGEATEISGGPAPRTHMAAHGGATPHRSR